MQTVLAKNKLLEKLRSFFDKLKTSFRNSLNDILLEEDDKGEWKETSEKSITVDSIEGTIVTYKRTDLNQGETLRVTVYMNQSENPYRVRLETRKLGKSDSTITSTKDVSKQIKLYSEDLKKKDLQFNVIEYVTLITNDDVESSSNLKFSAKKITASNDINVVLTSCCIPNSLADGVSTISEILDNNDFSASLVNDVSCNYSVDYTNDGYNVDKCENYSTLPTRINIFEELFSLYNNLQKYLWFNPDDEEIKESYFKVSNILEALAEDILIWDDSILYLSPIFTTFPDRQNLIDQYNEKIDCIRSLSFLYSEERAEKLRNILSC